MKLSTAEETEINRNPFVLPLMAKLWIEPSVVPFNPTDK